MDDKIPKKRGRKPKGGKIVKNEKSDINTTIEKKNIILHLKCRLSDIKPINDVTHYNPEVCSVEPYIEDNQYEIVKDSEQIDDKKDMKGDKQKKMIYSKLSELEKMLNTNNIFKKSDCFWCTCGFDSPTIHIPSVFYKEKYNVYGCFCSPECACSYLFNERIDDNAKFERYHLLNFVYGKIYNYEKNIKLAPNPYYTLNKFYGNLDIHEYRQLLSYERLLLIIDKPLTKIYPELHEDNNGFETLYDHKIVLKKINKVEKNKIINDAFKS
uniref:MYM-type domain-containing protein n=1 Tax=viral metagenome TaxID=1070528 RepID=A0A6C0EU52_9ZZZZ